MPRLAPRPASLALAAALASGLSLAPGPVRAADGPALDASPEVPREVTPIEHEHIGALLIEAHRALWGVAPGPERLLTAWAHASLETARGAQCFGHNLGNVTVTLDWQGPHYAYRVQERVRRAPDVWREQKVRFRAYGSPLEGAMDYWRVLAFRFGSQLARFDAGLAREAGEGLCESGYSTGDCAAYGKAVGGLYRSLRASYLHRLRDLSSPEAMTWAQWASLEERTGLAACTLWSE